MIPRKASPSQKGRQPSLASRSGGGGQAPRAMLRRLGANTLLLFRRQQGLQRFRDDVVGHTLLPQFVFQAQTPAGRVPKTMLYPISGKAAVINVAEIPAPHHRLFRHGFVEAGCRQAVPQFLLGPVPYGQQL